MQLQTFHHKSTIMQGSDFSRLAEWTEFGTQNLQCAGMDLSSTFHCVYIPPHLLDDGQPNTKDGGLILNFETTTKDLKGLGDKLKSFGVKQVIMEATGTYWFGVFEILDELGFEVCVINPKHARNIAGRKTDEADAHWLCRLHTFGLLRNSFIPTRDIWPLRSLLRQRATLLEDRTRYALRMQKELDAMNVKIHKVISDITGATGLSLIDYIAGDVPAADTDWSAFYNKRMKTSQEDFVKSLHGSFTPTGCFLLAQHLSAYRTLTSQVEELDRRIERYLFCQVEGLEMEDIEGKAPKEEFIRPLIGKRGQKLTKTKSKNAPLYNQRYYLEQLLGVDVTTIPGIGPQKALEVIAEIGADFGKSFPSAGHFTSWAMLSPNDKISGGKKIGSKKVTNANRVHQIFRQCAYSLSSNKGVFGQKYRSLKVRKSGKKANKAIARQLAVIFYHVVTKKEPYDEQKVIPKKTSKERKLKRLRKNAATEGYRLVPIEVA